MQLTILHTNDIHGHLNPWRGWEGELADKTVGGLGALGGAIAAARTGAGENCLLLDAGDLIGDSMIANLTQGKALVDALNHLGYDALTIGNHEPDFGVATLRQRIADAQFPVVAANLVDDADGSLFTHPYVIKKVGDVRVGILGLAYPKTARTTSLKNIEGLTFQPPRAVAEKYIQRIRDEGVDLLIALTHLGLSADEHLARSVKGIDVIVGGHSHNRMAQVKQIGETLIVQAGAHCSDPTAEYLVATNSMLAQGGHNQQAFQQGRDLQEHKSQYETIRTALRRMPEVAAPALGRIQREPVTA